MIYMYDGQRYFLHVMSHEVSCIKNQNFAVVNILHCTRDLRKNLAWDTDFASIIMWYYNFVEYLIAVFTLYLQGNADWSGFRIARELEHNGASLEYVTVC